MDELPKSEKYVLYLSLKDEIADEIEEHKYHNYRLNIRNYQRDHRERLKEYQKNWNINSRKQKVCPDCTVPVYEYYWNKHCMTKKHIKNKEKNEV